MDKTTKQKVGTIFLIIIVVILAIVVLWGTTVSKQKKDRVISYGMELNWTRYIPENYTGPYKTSRTILISYRDNWYKLSNVKLQHDIYPWMDKTVSLQFNTETGEHMMNYGE